ncbi:interleukin-17 receptor D isoform X1 [Hippocampus comes]|uniref:interleukin-17 receptor D isoform X1 n=1 Tax=Hippocampus comes TaxID=109280 RepID=UPI00094E69D6|nr:PREDICTED: interleukin-17 receptor D isoform X1 [Hippocampus comes]
MADLRSLFVGLPALLLIWSVTRGVTLSANRRNNQERCGFKEILDRNRNQPIDVILGMQSGADAGRRLAVTLRSDNCSLNSPLGKHVIHEVANVSFTHLACDHQAGVVVHWSASPLGIEHIKGFRVYLEDKNPDGKRCQHLILKDPRQLNFSYKNTKLSSQPFSDLSFDTDYMVRVVPFPTLMNDSFFPPSFLRTNSCEVLLGSENLICKPFWKPKMLSVSQLGSKLHVSFEQAPPSFAFHLYYVYYKLRQDGPFRLQRCKPDANQLKTTCILQDVTPGTYTIELRDESNTTRKQTQFYVSQVHSPWAGPIRAMAITVPLVIMSAFATLFTVMCRKKQQENIYSQLDEESSESSNQSAALSAERPRPRPKVFICYSDRDGAKHAGVIQSFAYFLQDFCGCEVVLDLWEHLEMCREGQMSWLSRQLDEANFIITVCSKGLRYFVERKSRRGKTPVGRRCVSSSAGDADCPSGRSGGDLFVVGVAMIAEKLRQAKRQESEERGPAGELQRFMAVYFDYSTENDIPTILSLATRFKLMDQLPQLFARLHSGRSGLAEGDSQPLNISRRNYFRSKSGRSLYVAICNMHQYISQNPDWFQKPAASCSPLPLPTASVSARDDEVPTSSSRPDGGLVLNEVLVKTPESGDRRPKKNSLLLDPAAAICYKLSPSPSPVPNLAPSPAPSLDPALPRSSSSRLEHNSSTSSQTPSPCLLRDEDEAPSAEASGNPEPPPPPPPPRDSGIYESSVPSSELSIPLMDGLSHEHADSSSLAESESSSSGLGDEEPPGVTSLGCGAPTVCKAELHHSARSAGLETAASL